MVCLYFTASNTKGAFYYGNHSYRQGAAAVGPYSQAIKVNGVLYASGQVGFDPATGILVGTTIAEQAEQVMKNVGAVLEAAD